MIQLACSVDMSSEDYGIFVLFPEDTLIEIFSYLPERDLQNVIHTCKRFRSIVGNSSSLLRAFEINSKQLKKNITFIKKFKYSNLSLNAGNLTIPRLTRAMEIMGNKLYRLELCSSE